MGIELEIGRDFRFLGVAQAIIIIILWTCAPCLYIFGVFSVSLVYSGVIKKIEPRWTVELVFKVCIAGAHGLVSYGLLTPI